MTIYLYVKTHRKTGLKYLGKTERDPYTYMGSGKYWKLHIKKHGKEVDTVILKECSSKEELIHWGLHYSKLWNIVDSEDWANLKPESGDGNDSEFMKGKMTGEKNPNFGRKGLDNPLYGRERLDMRGDRNVSCREDVKIKKSGKNHFLHKDEEKLAKCLERMTGDKNPAKNPKNVKKYSGANHSRYDHNLYTFHHNVNGIVVKMTRRQFIETYHNTPTGPSKIRDLINGIRKQYKGWRIAQR